MVQWNEFRHRGHNFCESSLASHPLKHAVWNTCKHWPAVTSTTPYGSKQIPHCSLVFSAFILNDIKCCSSGSFSDSTRSGGALGWNSGIIELELRIRALDSVWERIEEFSTPSSSIAERQWGSATPSRVDVSDSLPTACKARDCLLQCNLALQRRKIHGKQAINVQATAIPTTTREEVICACR